MSSASRLEESVPIGTATRNRRGVLKAELVRRTLIPMVDAHAWLGSAS